MIQQPDRSRVFSIRDMVILDYMIENRGITHWYDAKTIWCMVNTCGTRECTTPEGVFRPRWSVKQVRQSLNNLALWDCLEVRWRNFHKKYKVIHYYPKPVDIIGCGL